MIGIDEVGRGCWAGPLLVVAARPIKKIPAGLKDSKLLSKLRREKLFVQIELACELGEGWVQPSEIDRFGLAGGLRLGVARALQQLKAPINETIIIDGSVNYCPAEYRKSQAVIKADITEPIVSAASIYAKVRRDQFMTEAARQFPGYNFEQHVGYGTKAHVDALRRLGVSKLHRLSYKPVQAFL